MHIIPIIIIHIIANTIIIIINIIINITKLIMFKMVQLTINKPMFNPLKNLLYNNQFQT